MKKIELNKKLSRPMDRAKLGLKPRYKMEDETEDFDITRMQGLINNWWNADTTIGHILNKVYESTLGMCEQDLKEFITTCGSENACHMYVHLTRDTKEYRLVFERVSRCWYHKSEKRSTRLYSKYVKIW